MWNSSKFVVASIALCAAVSFAAGLVPQNLDYSDHLQELRNPARGVTGHKGFYLSPGKALDLKTNGTVYNDFMRFLVDLGGFSSNAWTFEGEGDAQVVDEKAFFACVEGEWTQIAMFARAYDELPKCNAPMNDFCVDVGDGDEPEAAYICDEGTWVKGVDGSCLKGDENAVLIIDFL